ncbi:Tyrosine--tRNA ligase [Bienertia sinuspersici]
MGSDDEVGFDNSSTADNFDWISKFLEDVGGEIDENSVCNGGLFNLGNVGRGGDTKDDDDSDDVVVVGEVIAPKLKGPKLW